MTGNEVREKFLRFFEGKKHTIVESDSLVPKDDPTVLFTTAGMQQFKRQFLGHIDDYTRATTSQKCLRTDDLDEVGQTDFHHTFFEMLGNFSFGDYFKKEAIAWAWEFLTVELNIPPDKLWVSIYKDDDEAEGIWLNDIGVDPNKLVKLGDKSNFWPTNAKQDGPNGPCGPCSEIFYDYGVNGDCTSDPCDPDCDCGRFSEVWNLVFTQFNRKDGGELEPLPNKNIDTGMGLERLVAVLQGKKNNYETDLFEPILKAIDREIGSINTEGRNERYVIADHLRAVVIGIADGVIPSNKDRGSVMRRLIIEMTDIAVRNTGTFKPTIHKLVPSVIEAMQGGYPELGEKMDLVISNIEGVEKAFLKVRKERVPEFERITESSREDAQKLGDNLFLYKSTYGLTLPTMHAILRNASIDTKVIEKAEAIYHKKLKEDQDLSRATSKMTGDVFTGTDIDLDMPKTKFTGYNTVKDAGTILKIYIGDTPVQEASEGDQVKIIFDQTPFYAESGGQIGDSGTVTTDSATIRIEDTQKTDDVFIHIGRVEKGLLKISQQAEMNVDDERRLSIMRHHTATHLLQAALREILGSHVQQQGSLVAEDRLRFDFTHPKAVSKDELAKIENKINGHIKQADPVLKEEMTLQEAKKKGALAFFAEKYKDRVRVISIGDYSKEFCGGTHLNNTGEIGQLVISGEGAVAQGIRRLEAKAGNYAAEYTKERETKSAERKQAEEKRKENIKNKKEADKQRLEAFKDNLKSILEQAESVNDTKVITKAFTDSDTNQLKVFFDMIKRQAPSVAVCFGSAANGSAALIVGISDDLVQRGLNANDLIKEISPIINGSGGGRPQLAQAGSKEGGKINSAIEEANKILKDKVKL